MTMSGHGPNSASRKSAFLPGCRPHSPACLITPTDTWRGSLNSWERAGLREDTLVLVLSDNGGSQEGGPLGGVNLLGPRNLRAEPMAEKLARIEDVGAPGSYANYPLGWAMASNTPLRRYKQNTHGGGIRDPLVISWPRGIAARGELRHQFVHACDVAPTLLDLVGVASPEAVNGVKQMPLEGTSFAASLHDPTAPSKLAPQYFEMLGHRGIVHKGWKAVAYHPPETPFEEDRWELYHLETYFSESQDLAAEHPKSWPELVELWWEEAEKHQVLPLDDRSASASRRMRRAFMARGRDTLFTPGSVMCRPRSHPTSAAAATGSAQATFNGTDNGVLIAHGRRDHRLQPLPARRLPGARHECRW